MTDATPPDKDLKTPAAPVTTNGVTIRDIVNLRYLHATLLAGEAGLDHRVTWAHVSDAFDPWNWLDAGDLVLTCGYIVPVDAEAQVQFIEKLSAAGLSGVVIGEDERRPHLSREMLEAADRLGLPVIHGAHEVGFAQYARFVAAANARDESHSFTKIARVHGEVMASLRDDLPGTEFIERLGQVVNCELFVVDPEMWEPLIRGGSIPEKSWRQAYRDEVSESSGRAPFVMHLTVGGRTALTMPIASEHPAALLAFPRGETPPQLSVLQQIAAAGGLEIGRVNASVERSRRSGATLLNDALTGRFEPVVLTELLRSRRLHGGLRALAIDGSSASIDRLARNWYIRGIPFLLGEIGRIAIAIVRADDVLRTDLEDRVNHERWRMGVSDLVSSVSNLGDAARQARWALETVSPDGFGVARYGEGRPTFLPRTLAESQATADLVLGPLINYDREQGTELIKTLRVYLECDRSPSRVSELMFIHTQTVNYRIARIQELTGRSLRSTGDVSELWFALRALALSQTTEAS